MIIDTLRNSLKLIDSNKIIAIHLSQEDYDEYFIISGKKNYFTRSKEVANG